MSADLHAAFAALADEWRAEAVPGQWSSAIHPRTAAERIRAVLAAHPATDADLIREAEQRGAAAVVARVNALADEHEAHHFGYYGGCTLCRTQDAYAALRAAVRATEETPT